MKPFVEFFIENRKFTYVLMLFLIVFGGMGVYRMNSESFPAVDFATATVTTIYQGAGPEEIEEKVTKPIEDEIRTVRGLKDTRSVSQSGQSKITIRVDMDNYDVEEAMDDLQKAVQRVSDLPRDLEEQPKFKELNSEEFPAIEIAILGSNENRKRDAFADFVKEIIEDNKKVLDVRLTGFQEREFSVLLLQDKLEEHHVSVSEVFQALQRRNQDVPAGDLESPNERLLVKLNAKVETANELADTFIRSNFFGKKVQLRDVAIVKDGKEEAVVKARVDGEEATLLIVTKKAGEDTIGLVHEIEKVIQGLEVPEGLSLKVYNNEAGKVRNRMDVLRSNAFAGLFFIIVFLLIFLPGRIGAFASFSLPIAMSGTMGVMYASGMNLDAITILALVIALGLVVDNSVVISENYARLIQTGRKPKDAAIRAVMQFWLPISCTAFTTIAAFLPMLVTKGVMGEFIRFIPVIVSTALLFSLAESFFLLPSRLVLATKDKHMKGGADDDENGNGYEDWFQRATDKFEALVRKMVQRRYLVAVGFTFLIGGSLFMLVKVNRFILFPNEQTEIYIARLEMPKGTLLEDTHRVNETLTREVQQALGDNIQNLVARAGVQQADLGDPKQKEGEKFGMLIIYVTREASFDLPHTEALEKLRKIKIPEAEVLTFEAQVNGPPVGDPVNATFRSNNQGQLEAVTSELVAFLEGVEGIVRPQTDRIVGADEIRVNMNYEKLSRLGLDVQTMGDAVKTALGGNVVTEITLNNKNFDLRVKYAGVDRESLDDLKNIKVIDSRGNLVPLKTVATFERVSGTPVIKRFDFQRAITVLADIDESIITSVEANARLLEKFEDLQERYPRVSVTFGGEQESTEESLQSLRDAMVLALIAIAGILVFLFSSYLRPVIIMSTIPLGLLGFAVAFYFHGRPVSFLSLLGVIGLAGIIVNSGIVLISFIDQLREEGKMKLDDILARASGLRLRAVVVTSLTTMSGLFPTAYGIGGHDAILVPMTLAMAWGLTSGTILTLVWVPCAYAILEDVSKLSYRFKTRVVGKLSKEGREAA